MCVCGRGVGAGEWEVGSGDMVVGSLGTTSFHLSDGAYRAGKQALGNGCSEGSLLSPNANSSGFKLFSLFDWTQR